MNTAHWMYEYRELQEKFDRGDTITQEDIDRAAHLVQTVGREEHRLLFGQLRQLKFQQETKEQQKEPEPIRVTDEELKAAQERVRQNPTIENLAEFSKLKNAWMMQNAPELLEPETPKVTLEQVKAAEKQAKQRPNPENLMVWSNLKNLYQRQQQQANSTQE
ncbi:hypothetical protein CVV65_07555 [Kyrpidia spormannii]|uniref:Uncharacterized protein n=2 Tax=Kyrpidia spormannii TaxID=2055160 RepID=A0A2K8N640_9BACL|nr:hypothetical protein CVV65_07555 [Kyrpidia spormannii]